MSSPQIDTTLSSEITDVQPQEATSPEYQDEVIDIEISTAHEKNKESESVSEEDNTEEKKYLDDQAIKFNIKSDDEGEDTPTLPLNKKRDKFQTEEKKKPPLYIFPLTRMKLAWARSSNVLDFVLKVIAIIFSTLGWLCCVGGVPFMSIAMLIIGCIYIDDCNIQPKIPVYLVVAGVFGTLQHILSVWTKYIPKDSQGPFRVYRAYCRVTDCTIQLFLIIWFVLGCIWVYGVPEAIEFREDQYSRQKDEYCNKTLYYFTFWMLNISFILLLTLVVVTLFAVICVIISPEKSGEN